MTRYQILADQGPSRAAKFILELGEAYGKDPTTGEETLAQGKAALEEFWVRMHAMGKEEGYALLASLHALAGVAEELKGRVLKHAVAHWGLKRMTDITKKREIL